MAGLLGGLLVEDECVVVEVDAGFVFVAPGDALIIDVWVRQILLFLVLLDDEGDVIVFVGFEFMEEAVEVGL